VSEEGPATPGWVQQELDEIADWLPHAPEIGACLQRYADCLAGSGPPEADPELARDGCRTRLLGELGRLGLDPPLLAELNARLEALEDEIAART
jgi:hypothetical protein